MHREHVCSRLPDDQYVGLVVGRMPQGHFHAGITYRWRGQLFLYHQAFHYDTKLEAFDPGVAGLGGYSTVITLRLRPDRQRAVAGFLNDMGKKNPQFPYSLRHDPKARIDASLGRLVTEEGKGLSCVTFVLAVLNSSQVRLVDGSTWPKDRPADLEAQKKLIAMLKRYANPTPEHLQAVEEEKGCVRVRPEEMGGAGCYLKWPVGFSEAEPASIYLLWQVALATKIPAHKLYPEAG